MNACDIELSIIIPTHNRRSVLAQMLDSLWSQMDGLPVEVIIADDYSSDDTWTWLQETTVHRANVVCVRLPLNSGPGPARNAGLAIARGRYFVPIDSDSLLTDGAIRRILRAIREETGYRMLFFPCLLYPAGQRLDQLAGRQEITRHSFLSSDLGELTPVVHLSYCREVGLKYPALRAGGEGILWAQLLNQGPALFIESPMLYYRTDVPQRICTLEYQLAHPGALAEVADSVLGLFPTGGDTKLKSARANKLLAAGTYHILAGNPRVGRMRLRSAIAEGKWLAVVALMSSAVGQRSFRALFRFHRTWVQPAYLDSFAGRKPRHAGPSWLYPRSKFLLRFDDICPTMCWSMWDSIEQHLNAVGIRPLIGVIPDNHDASMRFEPPNPRFWDRIRAYQARGWSIGVHGFRHQYVTSESGLLGINSFSEFAGISLEEQAHKVCSALDIFRREGVTPDAWIAPAHSFDEVTLQVLRAANVKTLSDGFSLRPFRDARGMLWIPQQLWRLRAMPFGVWTVCMHHNAWDRADLDSFRAQVERYRSRITSLPELQAAYGGRKQTFVDRLASRLILPRVRKRALAQTSPRLNFQCAKPD